ncbi:MAG: hypothetical protein QOG22_3471 [Pseudonocardiales bacterium]|jgi:hypothetical protein|nr:hypothetical protein [Pseudonocardiales bacterium]MDT4973328.1 hypothetical protein [Pseudonocardiales bacterium]MDT4980331.1 hypothetical protein [Pseudonocardiales bacterium]
MFVSGQSAARGDGPGHQSGTRVRQAGVRHEVDMRRTCTLPQMLMTA